MKILEILELRRRHAVPFEIPPRGKSWNPTADHDPSTGRTVVWPAPGATGMSLCFDPGSPFYHSTIVFATDERPANAPHHLAAAFLSQLVRNELRCISGTFGASSPLKAEGATFPETFRQVDYLEDNGVRSEYYEFSLKTTSWIGPGNYTRAVLRTLEKRGARLATRHFLVPKTYTLRPYHELFLDGLLRVSWPLPGNSSRQIFVAYGFGSRFVDGYLEANNWPLVKPEISGLIYGTDWRPPL